MDEHICVVSSGVSWCTCRTRPGLCGALTELNNGIKRIEVLHGQELVHHCFTETKRGTCNLPIGREEDL